MALDLDEALPARPDRIEQRVIAEPGIWTPISSAARITSVPLGTLISCPSMVSDTISTGGVSFVGSANVTYGPSARGE